MKRAMNGFQPFLVDVSVDLGCCDIGMTEHELDRAQVGTVCQEVGGERVAEHVGRDW